MGNCQAIDNASLVIQHPNGKVDRILYGPIAANQIMKMYPGHYVALLLTTTLYSSVAAATGATSTAKSSFNGASNGKNTPLRITRIKLLRPTDVLALGHVYRLVTSQDVMKGVLAKKQAKMDGKINEKEKPSSEFEAVFRKNHELEKKKQEKHVRDESRSRNKTSVIINSAAMSKSRGWQPSLRSISEAAS